MLDRLMEELERLEERYADEPIAIEALELQAQAGPVWVFSSPKDPQKHRTRQAVWWDVKRAAKAFRLPQNVAPHSLRKLYAVDLLNRCGGNLGRVQRALNHSDAATTHIYAMAYEIYRAKYGTTEQGK